MQSTLAPEQQCVYEPSTPDIRIEQHGSVWLFFGSTEEGTDWLFRHLPEHPSIAGGVAVPWSNVEDVLDAMERDVLRVL